MNRLRRSLLCFALATFGFGWAVAQTNLRIPQAGPATIGQSVAPAAMASPPRSLVDQPIYIYRSEATAQMLGTRAAEYEDWLAHWGKYLDIKKRAWSNITRAQLLKGLLPGVLIVPSAQVLDQPERQAIADFRARGGNLWGTGQLGSRDRTGRFTNHEFLQTAFNTTVHGYFGDGIEWFLQPFGDGPLTWSLPSGRRVDVGRFARDTLPRLKANNLAAVINQWSREKDDEPTGAIAYDETTTSRSVYYSFPESSWDFHKTEDVYAMLDSTLAWLQRAPRAYKAAWPDGKIASHLIEMDTEDKFFSAPSLADHLESIGVRGTFYSVTSEAIKFPKVVPELMRRGHEIAYHADIHYGFKLEPIQQQDLRIQFMLAQMRTLMGDRLKEATGFRAPTESYDTNTERLLRRHGLLHHAADPAASDDRLPMFSRAEPRISTDEALVVLPRTQMDDVDFVGLNLTSDEVYAHLTYDLDLTMAQGAFGLLSVHSQNYVPGGLMLRTMGRYVAYVSRFLDRLWVARGDQITLWWRQREKVSVVQEVGSASQQDMRIRVSTPASIRGLTVFVTNPYKNARLVVERRDARAPLPTIKVIDTNRSALVFDQLDPGESQYSVRFSGQ